MIKRKKLVSILLVSVIGISLIGCRYNSEGVSSSKPTAIQIDEPINPNNENFKYIDSARTVEDGIITITFRYRLEED